VDNGHNGSDEHIDLSPYGQTVSFFLLHILSIHLSSLHALGLLGHIPYLQSPAHFGSSAHN